MSWAQAFGHLHRQVSTLHPTDRDVTVTVTPEAMLSMAKEMNEFNLRKMSEAELLSLQELRFYGMRVLRGEEQPVLVHGSDD